MYASVLLFAKNGWKHSIFLIFLKLPGKENQQMYPPRFRKGGIKIKSLNTTSFQSKGKCVYSQVSRQTTVSSKCSSSSSTGG